MSLANSKVTATIAVSDMAKAKEFYEGKLGLTGGKDQADGGHTYDCAGGTKIHVYPSEQNAGKNPATAANWEVEDVDATVDELAGKGVKFEQYDQPPIKTNEKGVATIEGQKAAWFKDPDGNILAVGNM
jgi:catechol 2,3-dioxygenase-like lactoylglutathione lyase family enzyme